MSSNAIDSLIYRDMFGADELCAVFSDENLVQCWLDYEAALARAEALAYLARRKRNTILPGRTHGQHALPSTFGFVDYSGSAASCSKTGSRAA
jgi:adenylosuccinate lyase